MKYTVEVHKGFTGTTYTVIDNHGDGVVCECLAEKHANVICKLLNESIGNLIKLSTDVENRCKFLDSLGFEGIHYEEEIITFGLCGFPFKVDNTFKTSEDLMTYLILTSYLEGVQSGKKDIIESIKGDLK